MTKKDFVALADAVRDPLNASNPNPSDANVIDALVAFCRSQNPRFDEQRWRDYLAGKCGPNGGKR